MGRRAGQEVNNCVTSPWPGSRVELSSGLCCFHSPHPPTVPRMIVREQNRYFRGHVHTLSLSLSFSFNPFVKGKSVWEFCL